MTRRVLGSLEPSVLCVVVISAIAFAVFGPARESDPAPSPAVAGSGIAAADRPGATASSVVAPQRVHLVPTRHWQRLLVRLDRWRTAAWRRGDVELLRHVYTASSPGLTAERRMLDRYRERGLRVTGVRLTFGRVVVLDRAPRRVVLDVIDQLGTMRAVSTEGPAGFLPRDKPSHHRIRLRRTATGWLIASIQAADKTNQQY